MFIYQFDGTFLTTVRLIKIPSNGGGNHIGR